MHLCLTYICTCDNIFYVPNGSCPVHGNISFQDERGGCMPPFLLLANILILTRREQEVPHFYKWWDELR